jgi:dihydroorotase
VAGGFTGICAMPNTDPVCDNQGVVGFVIAQAQRAAKARVYPDRRRFGGAEGASSWPSSASWSVRERWR